jgi:uncharacterized protein YgiM (DUF1202 family)
LHPLKRELALAVLVVFGSFIAPLYSQETKDEYPFTGIVNANDTNLRAGSNLNYEIVTQLQKGDIIYVAGGWLDWLKVRCPENTLLWISDGFIDQGLITANKLNVRSGPDLKFNVICQVMKGDKVEVVRKSEDGKWCGIKAPDNAYLWVSRQFVEKKGAAEIFNENANRRNEVKKLLEEQEALYETWMKKEATEGVPYDELIAGFENIAKNYPDFVDESATATRRAEQLKVMKKKQEEKIASEKRIGEISTGTSTTTNTSTSSGTSTGSSSVAIEKGNEKKTEGTLESRYVTAKGTLSAATAAAGSDGTIVYKVMADNKLLCVIKSKVVDLNQYVGKRAQVWGNQEFSSSWDAPLIEVNRIKLIK